MKLKKVSYLMIHHSAIFCKENLSQFFKINTYHKALYGLKSSKGYYMGYNYSISSLGAVRQARKDGERTVACWQNGLNDGRCIHICIDGDFTRQKPAPAQIYVLRDLLRRLVKKHGINKNNIVFHKHFAQTLCPGNLDLVFIKSLVSKNAISEAEKETISKVDIINKIKMLLEKLK